MASRSVINQVIERCHPKKERLQEPEELSPTIRDAFRPKKREKFIHQNFNVMVSQKSLSSGFLKTYSLYLFSWGLCCALLQLTNLNAQFIDFRFSCAFRMVHSSLGSNLATA